MANVILFRGGAGDPERWQRELSSRLPDLEWRSWPDAGDPSEVDFTLLFQSEPGFLGQFPNLKAILATGAGVDGIFLDPSLSADVPIARINDPSMTAEMAQWALYGALHFFRRFHDYARLQANGEWEELDYERENPPAGILGCGEIGTAVGRRLAEEGFDVAGWTRTPRDLGEIRNFAGADELDAFLERSRFLVCMLPLTDETRGILAWPLFRKLPRGAFILNLARGGHLNQDDLLAALDEGQIGGAFLDVTDPEPLPADHPLWRSPNVVITPHISGITTPETAADQVAENIRRSLAGEELLNLVDRSRGY